MRHLEVYFCTEFHVPGSIVAVNRNTKKIFARSPCYLTVYKIVTFKKLRMCQDCYRQYFRTVKLVLLASVPSEKVRTTAILLLDIVIVWNLEVWR